jgi:hypothetical protein
VLPRRLDIWAAEHRSPTLFKDAAALVYGVAAKFIISNQSQFW